MKNQSPKWNLTKIDQRDGSAQWHLWNSETETNYEGALARRMAASLEARGIEVEHEVRFAYGAGEVGLSS